MKLLVTPSWHAAELVKVLLELPVMAQDDELQTVRIRSVLKMGANVFHQEVLVAAVEAGSHVVQNDKARRAVVSFRRR